MEDGIIAIPIITMSSSHHQEELESDYYLLATEEWLWSIFPTITIWGHITEKWGVNMRLSNQL